MNASPVRFGVIGCGAIAYWMHLRALKALKQTAVVAVADPDEGARNRARDLTGAETYDDIYPLLRRDDVEAVIISAPTHLHASIALTAVRAGKHIYLEKPIATTVDEARELIALVERAGVRAVTGFNRRYHPLFRQVRTLLDQGAIGGVRSVLSTFCEPTPATSMPVWKRDRSTGGGVLLDLASHHIDLLRWFLRDEVADVSAGIESIASEQDQAWLRLRLCGGVTAQGFFSFVAGPADFVEFLGERGTLRVDRHRRAISLRVQRSLGYGLRSRFPLPPSDVLRWWPERMLRASSEPSYARSVAAFAAAIRGQPTDLATLEDGLRSLEIVLAAESAGSACAS